jgi:hypothetical protein
MLRTPREYLPATRGTSYASKLRGMEINCYQEALIKR